MTDNWKDIHKDFGGNYGKHYKKWWQDRGFDYNTTKQWIEAGLDPYDYDLIIATYARAKGYHPSKVDIKELKQEYWEWEKAPKAQEYLDIVYPSTVRSRIKELDLSEKNLTGELDISDFPNLQIIYVNKNKLTNLTITNGQQLERLDCYDNKLATLNLTDCSNLKTLGCSYNNLTKLDFLNSLDSEKLEELHISNNNIASDLNPFSKFVNLKWLVLGNNPFTGSLKPLRDLNKLERLNISDTDISHGLEYLPESIKGFDCSFTRRPESRVSDIWEELQPFKG